LRLRGKRVAGRFAAKFFRAPFLKTKLILFDIDGTLITSGGAGERSLRMAVKDRFGADDDLKGIEIAGRTDTGIARQLFTKYGVAQTPEKVRAFFDRYLHHLSTELGRSKGTLLPGIPGLLDALKARPHLAVALLTGNLSRGAEIKLTHYGIWEFFEFGAYADDNADRNQLGRFARARALEKHGVEFSPADIYVIGDTPHDIDCGRVFGARTVAIATGNFTREQLAAHNPDYLFDDLSNADEVIAKLGL
jgi:phosphoglycolate phosphatase